ncbi:sensor histidine kinase [Kineosporia babensis]|uniref:histidine kinase n=1 Tax=Kineosporia babensis TaxID=499548 RepID=A0A9X1NKK6_9ACTN|nr:HAMP domain-containing sensor histidine kinase [Kineosporia babensis]MCD5316005.1 HAMP domain-containing histidine kinase [Kineosporia babensis]
MRIPAWARTVRARLTLLTSALLVAATGLILLAVYLVLSSQIEAEPLDPVTVQKYWKSADGEFHPKPGARFQAADLASVQRAVNYNTLERLRAFSLLALAVMFLLSLVIGWFVAGRMLRPVGRITATTREIGATDLTRRIGAQGPHDELRELADTIDAMLGRLDAAFRAERDFVEDVSHELRNPVAVIRANVEAVLADESSTPEQRQEATTVVTRATDRMARLLEDLLATARRRSGAFEDVDVDLAAVAADAVDEHRVLATERSLVLRERLVPGPTAYGEPGMLNRAVGNLLSNAIRHAPGGSVVTTAAGSQGGWAWIAVRDEGPGIPESEQERVFDRFVRGANGTGHVGTGLGLSIARQVVESHGGRLVVFSELGVGSTFVIWLPDRAVARLDDSRALEPPGQDPLGARG